MDERRASCCPPARPAKWSIRGSNVTGGYRQRPRRTPPPSPTAGSAPATRASIDEDGYLHLTGRIKEIINRGGEKISPREMDEALLDHPAVAQAVTFALPHEKLGEEVGAAIVLRDGAAATEAEIRDFARGRLAPFKVPRRVVFVPEIPKGATGKMQRIGLAEKLGLVELAPRVVSTTRSASDDSGAADDAGPSASRTDPSR